MSQLYQRGVRWGLLLALLTTLVGCDQATKQYAVEHFKDQPAQSYLWDTLRIQYAENPGAFLSLAANFSPQARFILLTVFNAAILLLVGAYLFWQRDLDRWVLCGLALILAGGIGNLIDRVTLGIVIDFLNLGIGPVRTGIFNVADMAISAGFVMLIPHMFHREPSPPTDVSPLEAS